MTFNLWKGKKTKDYYFQDRVAKDFVNRSGTSCLFHKYIGPYKQSAKDSSSTIPEDDELVNEMTIQDVLFGENRDRMYSDELMDIRGIYTISDNDFDLTQFGYLLSGDSIVVEFHTNDTIEKLGRKPMTGDVIEMVHLRDDTSLDSSAGEIKKFYVVQDSNRSANGYGPTWFSHIWRCRCTPIVDTQEYRSILHNQNKPLTNENIDWLTDFAMTGESDAGVDDGLGNVNRQSVYDVEMTQMEKNVENAKKEVEKRMFYANHMYIKDKSVQAKTGLINFIHNGDEFPSNFAGDIIYSGDLFPESPSDGDFFVRTDYIPARLFKRVGDCWKKVSDVWREEWVPANRILESYLNNNNITTVGLHEDQTMDEKQALSKILEPKTKDGIKIVPTELPKLE